MSDLSSERFALPHEIQDQVRDDGRGAEHPITLHASHFSREKQVRFLEALALWGSVRAACRAVPAAPQTVYRHRRASRDFALAWDAAMLVARPHVEDVLSDRALNGVEEPVFYHGEEIARRRRFDSRLLLAHLARLDKAEDRDEVREVAEGFDAALERLARGEPVDPLAAEDDDVDDSDFGDGPEPWMNERVPFVERVLLYLESLESDEDGEGQDGVDYETEDLPDPFAPEEDDESFDPADYILKDRVTPVTPPASAAPRASAPKVVEEDAAEESRAGEGADESGDQPVGITAPTEAFSVKEGSVKEGPAKTAPAKPAPQEPAVSEARWTWRPINDGRCSRMY